MTKASYSSTSIYANTPQVTEYLEYLDFWNGIYVYPSPSDSEYVVQSKYNQRPDLLSFDLYGTTGWWWIFALRNPDTIKDPIYDLKAGITIYLVDKSNLPKTSVT